MAWAGGAVRQWHDVVDRGAAWVRSLAAIDLRPFGEQLTLAYLARPVVAMKYRLRWKRFVVAAVLNAPTLMSARIDSDIERRACVVSPRAEPDGDLLVKRSSRPARQPSAWKTKSPRLEGAFSGAVFASVSPRCALSEWLLTTEALPPLRSPLGCLRSLPLGFRDGFLSAGPRTEQAS